MAWVGRLIELLLVAVGAIGGGAFIPIGMAACAIGPAVFAFQRKPCFIMIEVFAFTTT